MRVFYTSPWVPAEWIKAHGLEPRGVWDDGDFGPDALPPTAGVCAFAHAMVRLAERRADDAVVFTSHCDQLRRGFDVAAGAAPARVFLLNLPATWQGSVAERMFGSELERLGRFLVKLGGHPPSTVELATTMADYGQARKRLIEAAPGSTARGYAEAVARFHCDGSVNLPRTEPEPAGQRRVPLALVGGPLPRSQWAVLDAIEHAGGRIVLNATEAGERSLALALAFETVRREPVLGALARGYVEACVDVFQRPNTRLYDWLKERLASRQARGIVLWHYVGCDLWRAEAQSLREAFGLPVLQLDAGEPIAGSRRNCGRIEAFLEALR